MSSKTQLKVNSPNVKYSDDFIEVNYEYQTSHVERMNTGGFNVSKIDKELFLLRAVSLNIRVKLVKIEFRIIRILV